MPLMTLSCVLQIPELLELILFHLDNCTLLHATRVSRNFKVIITTSPTLQCKLFFRPEPHRSAPTISRALSNLISSDTFHSPFSQNVQYFYLNSLLVDSFAISFDENGDKNTSWSLHGNDHAFCSLPRPKNATAIPAYAWGNASWRRMLVSNPPIRTVHFNRKWSHGDRSNITQEKPSLNCGPDGLKMGLLYDLLQKYVEQEKIEMGSWIVFSIKWPLAAGQKGNWLGAQDNWKDRYVRLEELALQIEIHYILENLYGY